MVLDCVGLIIARMWGIPMLTGDKGLKDFEEVTFVGGE